MELIRKAYNRWDSFTTDELVVLYHALESVGPPVEDMPLLLEVMAELAGRPSEALTAS